MIGTLVTAAEGIASFAAYLIAVLLELLAFFGSIALAGLLWERLPRRPRRPWARAIAVVVLWLPIAGLCALVAVPAAQALKRAACYGARDFADCMDPPSVDG